MRILIHSYFFPGLGGILEFTAMMAEEFTREGHEVRLWAPNSGEWSDSYGYEVHRKPGILKALDLARWSDVCLQVDTIKLKAALPLMAYHRPLAVNHQKFMSWERRGLDFRPALKKAMLKHARNICISRAVAENVPAESTIIPNPYDDEVFKEYPDVGRDQDLVFVGRLEGEKGAEDLLNAVAALGEKDIRPSLTIVGAGSEEGMLRALAGDLELGGQVSFKGCVRGEELASVLNSHRVMVVPSRWEEPFGIVALEGIACGCAVVGSRGGGLRDAIGPCGVTYENGNVGKLTAALEGLLTDPGEVRRCRERAGEHLERHRKKNIAREYLKVFEEMVR
ncbi:MAG: glycosyltransferase [Candidatus Altiarchaeales archaeon]|nr:glycosyltransferase [Candidatus Altiarchaeales archaeon]MBD3415510.1 glycosyltransferase [Candidatus Altiarchaeales archaeon]